MSVFSRFSDIINSNINAILDQAEDPEKMVRMITQEMEETLVEVRSTSARYLADKKQVAKRADWHRDQAKHWESKAELAISRGRDDLAKAALKERSVHEEAVAQHDSEVEAIDAALTKLKDDTRQLEEKLQTARARQKSLVVRGKTAKQRIGVKRQVMDTSFDQAFEKFELYEQRIDQLEGEIESYDLGTRTLANEIDDLAKDEQLDVQLQTLKAKMGKNSSEHVTQ